MNWETFTENVKNWSAERGIYEHSTPRAQALKALSELGEVADAVVKNDKEALKDGIGDVAVCVINWLVLTGDDAKSLTPFTGSDEYIRESYRIVALTASRISSLVYDKSSYGAQVVLVNLQELAKANGLDFLDCCEWAWEAIKHRKGRMIEGGVFVKEEAA